MKYCIHSLCLVLLLSFFAWDPAKAEEPPKSTSTHDIGFIFHKLSGSTPDYNKWVDAYTHNNVDSYGEEGLRALKKQTRNIFVNQFKNFQIDHQKEIIMVLPATMEIVPFERKYLVNIDLGQDTPFIYKETPEFKINFVMPELDSKLRTIIDEDIYSDIKKNSGHDFVKPVSVNIFLTLSAVSVDSTRPLVINGEEYWMMLADFVTYEVWDFRKVLLFWEYISLEDVQQKLDELRSLYKTSEDLEQEEMQ